MTRGITVTYSVFMYLILYKLFLTYINYFYVENVYNLHCAVLIIVLYRYVSVQIIKNQPDKDCGFVFLSSLALCEVQVFGLKMAGEFMYKSSSKLRCISECGHGCFGCLIQALSHPGSHVACHQLFYDTDNSTEQALTEYSMFRYSFNNTMGYFKDDIFH